MERSSKGHMDETLNLRSFYLRLIKRIWILPLAAVLGALIAALIYFVATVAFGPGREYSAESKLYINFAYDEKKGSKVDYYNAFTWNTLVSTDDILEFTIANLEKDGITVFDVEMGETTDGLSISRDELVKSINADIPSDVRVMVLTARNSNKELADAIINASSKAIENYGAINEAFDSIKILSCDKAKLIVYSDRSKVAAGFGAIALLILTVLALLLKEALNDAIYVPEDIEKRYGISALGVTFNGKVEENNSLFKNELRAALEESTNGEMKIALISTDSVDSDKESGLDAEEIKKNGGDKLQLLPMSVPGKVLDNYRKIGVCDGVIVCVPYGINNGTMTEHVLGQLKKHNCPVIGMVLTRADYKFMVRYYGIK
ncbi:YveK family protein [Butyrivibrio sp. YAB3001]|uniref:YveK family protein n=1 Tax=Butyrivibrio sp. YAB3001 TaxID=1520812 RepID=UPI0008F64333|nr:hypothetical protein [Butyrivibrio sp. YAB3001]SFC17447.1 Capsular polysaccharide biosynthesis protein [Butyrivibrio sp. YAB3001]